MRGAREVSHTEVKRVKQEAAARVATLLKGEHEIEVKRLNELFEQSCL